MTTEFLSKDIATDEGCRFEAYPDPISKAEPITIGYGHTGGIKLGNVWTQEQCDEALNDDIQKAENLLTNHISWWTTLNDARQDCLVNMCFNMGWGNGSSGLSAFHMALAALESGDYETSANQFLNSLWAKQVPNRAHRLAEQIRTGVRS